jgi:hypothetical protein
MKIDCVHTVVRTVDPVQAQPIPQQQQQLISSSDRLERQVVTATELDPITGQLYHLERELYYQVTNGQVKVVMETQPHRVLGFA